MKKNLTILTFLLLCLTYRSQAECVLVPLSLQERVAASELIVEAIVDRKLSYWNYDRTMIYTSTTLVISKVYKGSGLISASTVNMITLGGTVGMQAIRVEPELETENGEIGIFMLVHKNGEWVAESGPQGIIRIDKHTATASDVFNTYPAFSIAAKITELTNLPVISINEPLTRIRISSKRSSPVILSISPKTITAGTSSVLTIKGSDFESAMDTNSVQFKNADDGGVSYAKAMKYDYLSWSDTMIRLIVRSKAGTGKIRIVVGGNGTVISTDTLTVSYAHLNVVSGDSIGFETQEIGMNTANGITWKMNQSFFDSMGARGAFARSLERWRCGTYINWDTLGRVSHSAIKPDGVNICAWDTSNAMPNGVLAQCFSYWSGCFSPGIKWFVNELDIRFRIKPTNSTNWNYTAGNASGSQFHFESVATHELGHGHQMGHVINSPAVMHFSISNGQTKPGLSANDISGGNYVINKSGAMCGKNAHAKLNSGNCAMVAPLANYTIDKSTICKNESVTFTDSSLGNISVYKWNFGSGATPATATTKGPHLVKYTTGGTKTITLTITTILGNLVKSKNITVSTDSRMISNFSYTAAEKGKVTFTNSANNPTANMWYFGDGDSSGLVNPVHVYVAGGSYNVTLVATNTCDSKDSVKPVKFAWLNFYMQPLTACIGEEVTYIDSSDNNVASWQWTFTGATPSSASGKGPHSVTYSSAGNKQATLAITVAGAPAQSYTRNNTAMIGTDTFARASFVFGYYGKNLVGFRDKSTGSNKTYKWYFGDGDSSTLKDPLHQYTNANMQTVRLVINSNCNTDDTTIQLRDFTSVTHVQVSSLFAVYPNPVRDFMEIISPLQVNYEVELYDVSGKTIWHRQVSNGEKIPVSALPDGLYFVKISAGEMTEYSRIVIAH